MPSLYMPDVEVHIAFNAGYNTPAASRTWTDVSQYVELHDRIRIAFGRQDERATAGANTVSLTLDNSDGRFTAMRSASPYFPNVKMGRPIRVRATPVGGTASTRFVGFIDEWPVEWEGTDAYAKARITASSRTARLGLSTTMRSMVEQAVMAIAPAYYYTLGDPSGSTTAADSSGRSGAPLTVSLNLGAPPAFGSGTGPTDGLTAAVWTPDSAPLQGRDLPTALTWSATFNISSTSANTYLLRVDDGLPSWAFSLEVDATGVLRLYNIVGTSIAVGGINVADGVTHHVAVVLTGTTATLYLDGTATGSPVSFSAATPATTLRVGGVAVTGSLTMSHVAAFVASLTAPQIAALATAIRTSSAGERTDQRLVRILGWAGVATSEITVETGQQTMTYQKTSGQSFVDALREVESTEAGVLYDRPDGNVGFHNRAHRYLATPAATLNMAAQHVGADYSPKLDRSTLVNEATVTNPTTGETARNNDSASRDEYGIAAGSTTMTADTFAPLQQRAYWMTVSYATPRPRVPSLTVDVAAHQGLTPSAQTLLGVTLGDLLAVTNAPMQADTSSPSYFVEGYTEDIGPESYSISFNLSPTYPTLNTFVLNDATRGVLDSSYVLAL